MSGTLRARRAGGSRILLVFGGTAVGLLLAWVSLAVWHAVEHRPPSADDLAAIRARLDDHAPAIFMSDPDIQFRLKPSHTGLRYRSAAVQKTNSRGMLGAEEVGPGPAGGNILFLGDSVTYGEGAFYPATFVPFLQEKAGNRFKLYNASSPAWSTAQETGYFDKFARDLPWTAVVVVFYPNDLVTLKLVDRDRGGTMEVLDDNMDFGELLTWRLKLLQERRRLSLDETTRPLSEEIDYVLLSWVPEAWKSYESEVLVPFLQKNHGLRIVFAALPSLAQLEALHGRGAPPEIALYPQRRLAEFCRRHNVPFIDATAALGGARDATTSLFVDAYHLSERGHRAVADYLWPFLERLIASGATPSP